MAKTVSVKQMKAAGLSDQQAQDLVAALRAVTSQTPVEWWEKVSKRVLTPETPFALHQLLFQTAYSDWNVEDNGPPPAWVPDPDTIRGTNLHSLMKETGHKSYAELHRWSTSAREDFWQRMVTKLGITFKVPYSRVLDQSAGSENPKWFVGAQMNIADSCFLADKNAVAIVYQKEGSPLSQMTYGELYSLSSRVAMGLTRAGFAVGDAIAIDMSMTVEAVGIYLGIVMAGCVAVSIADSFAPDEIKTRLEMTKTKAIFTQDYIERAGKKLPMYEKILAADAPQAVVLPWGPKLSLPLRKGDLDWYEFLSDNGSFTSVVRPPDSPTNLLFSSGTTGEPKVIPWSHTTPIKAAVDGHLHHDIHPGEIVAWPTNLGWMMGPWLIYASLINRGTMALYYGAPMGREFGLFIEHARVQVLGLVPSIVKAWRSTDCMKGVDWKRIKAFSSTGECSNADDYLFLMSLGNYKPVIEYCGGTEIGGGFLTGTLVQAASPATFSTPAMGLDLEILGEDGKPADKGEVYLIPPSLGLSLTLLNRDHHKVYFEGAPRSARNEVMRRHGDEVERLPYGYFRALGRADDTMNLGGIKVSSAEIERVLNRVDGITETAAIAINPQGGGPSLLVVFAVLAGQAELTKIKGEMQKTLRDKLNPLFKIEDVVPVASLPRTASNKVMRRTLRAQYQPSASKPK